MHQRSAFVLVCVVATACVFAGGAAAGSSQQQRSRTVAATYQTPAAALLGPFGFTGTCVPAAAAGCVSVPIAPRERFVRVEIADLSGRDVHAYVFDGESDQNTYLAEICTRSRGPIFLEGAQVVDVWVIETPCPDGTPSVATTGTIRLVLSARS